MKRKWTIALGLTLLIILNIRAQGSISRANNPEGIPDDSIGLVHESVDAVPTPDPVRYNASDPGELPLLPRWNEVAPPFIPHGIDDFLPITKSGNACIDCHAVAEGEEGEPTPVPESHYRDLRNAPEILRDSIAGSRYVCTSCHVPQTDARPLPMDLP